MVQERHVRRRLQKLDETRYARFRTLESEVYKLLEYSQAGTHLSFTPHGASHVTAVELNYDWLLSPTDVAGLNASEIFCLLTATILHDALMIPRRPGDEERARQTHATAPLHFLLTNEQRLAINSHEAHAISEIIRAHSVQDLVEIDDSAILGRDRVDLRKLGAILSMGDICHADESRAPQIVFDYLNLDPDSAVHWRRHLQIGGITRNASTIEVDALVFSEEAVSAIETYVGEIKRQLEITSPYFRSQLWTIDDVSVKIKRLSSPLQQELTFRVDTQAVLGVLISGVYERDDVFIRELVQNSLDASYIKLASAFRRSTSHEPIIVVTEYKDTITDSIRAIRVDDNGCGMDATDIQDTLLVVGRSVTHRKSVHDLLKATTQKNLIASFGIGLLSCLKVAERVVITTKKGSNEAIRVEFTGVGELIRTAADVSDQEGTSVLVELKPEYHMAMDDPQDSLFHYFRMVIQSRLLLLELDWSESTAQLDRTTILGMGSTSGTLIDSIEADGYAVTEISGDDFSGWIWIDDEGPDPQKIESGSTTILNDGVYVTTEDSSDWLTAKFSSCQALINFSAQSVDLATSRDKIIQNDKLEQKKREIAQRSMRIIGNLARSTHERRERKKASLQMARFFKYTVQNQHPRFFAEMDLYKVALVGRDHRTLKDIKDGHPAVIYISYSIGNKVKPLAPFDGRQLYHKEDDLVTLQGNLLSQRGEIVIRAERDDVVVETTLVSSYLAYYKVAVVDLTKEYPAEGTIRSKPVPKRVRDAIGNDVKLVELEGQANQRAWQMGKELWLNVAHPEVAAWYEALSEGNLSEEGIFLAKLYVSLLANRFNPSLADIARRFQATLKE